MNINLIKGHHKRLVVKQFNGSLSITEPEFTLLVDGFKFSVKNASFAEHPDRDYTFIVTGNLGSKNGADHSPAELQLRAENNMDLKAILMQIGTAATVDPKVRRRLGQKYMKDACDVNFVNRK